MDPQAGYFAVLGALAAGVPQVVSIIVQSISARGQRKHEAEQAEAKRIADAKAAEAERSATAAALVLRREHEATRLEVTEAAQKRTERRETINRWRASLHGAAEEDRDWQVENIHDSVRPNIVGAQWFEELRQHLGGDLYNATRVYCDDETVKTLSREITNVAEEWKLD